MTALIFAILFSTVAIAAITIIAVSTIMEERKERKLSQVLEDDDEI